MIHELGNSPWAVVKTLGTKENSFQSESRRDAHTSQVHAAQRISSELAQSKTPFKTMKITWGTRNEGACQWQCKCMKNEAGCNSEDKCTHFHFDSFTRVYKLYGKQMPTPHAPQWPAKKQPPQWPAKEQQS